MFHENLGLKLFSLLMAVFIWVQSLLISEHRTVIDLPVALKDIPKNITLNSLPKSIPFAVRGKGLEIIKLKLSRTKINLDASKIRPGSEQLSLADYSIDLPENIQLTLLGPAEKQEIAVQADVFHQKKVPVELSFTDLYTRQRFANLNYQLIPDKLVVFGPKSKIQLIERLTTEEINRSQLSEREFVLKVNEPEKDVSLAVNSIRVRISSSFKTTRVFDSLPVFSTSGAEYFPSRVTLKLSGDSDLLNKLDPQSIKVLVGNEPDQNGLYQLSVEAPGETQVIGITPQKVRKK